MALEVEKKPVHCCVIGFLSISCFVVFVTLLALGVDRDVKQNEYVVQYYDLSKQFGPILSQGKHNVKVDTEFISFPRTVYDLRMGTVSCLSSDKIEIDLTTKVQVRLIEESLIPIILKEYNNLNDYENWLRNFIESILIETCLDYNVNDFFLSRSDVDSAMFQAAVAGVNEQDKDFGATIEFLQVTNIQLPEKLVSVITEKQNVEQEAITAANDRTNVLITATTSLRESEQEAQITLISANNIANITLEQASIQAQIIENKYLNLAIGYGSIINALNLNIDQFIDYLGSELYAKAKNSVVN